MDHDHECIAITIQNIQPHATSPGYLVRGTVVGGTAPTDRTVYLPLTVAMTLGPIVAGSRWRLALERARVQRAELIGGGA